MPKQKHTTPTIRDVAELAHTSISTVSRVINGKANTSPEVTKRIEQAITNLNYRSNSVARALKVHSTNTLGLIIPSVENPAFGRLAKSIESTADDCGFSTILCNSDGDIEKEIKYIQLLLDKQVDGILFNAIGLRDDRFSILCNIQTPVLIIGRKIPGLSTANVTVDNRQGACSAVLSMLMSGLKRIAFIYGQQESVSAIEDRFRGYRDALSRANIPFDKDLIIFTRRISEAGEAAIDELIERNITFDGIFASNDIIALGCLKRLTELGYRVPEKVSIMGFDMIPFSRMSVPQLSTVDSKLELLGREAVKTIVEMIHTPHEDIATRIISPELVPGGTTRCTENAASASASSCEDIIEMMLANDFKIY